MPESSPTVARRTTLHKGRKFDFELVTTEVAPGRTLTREVVRHPGAVLILPVLPDGRIVLIRNRRIAVDAWLYELPAGTLEPGEDPADCARRELEEETGYRAQRMDPLVTFYTTPGLTDEKMRAFVATGLTSVGQALEEDENIEVHPTPIPDVLAMIDRGELVDGKSILALLLALRRGLLREAGSGAAGGGGGGGEGER